MEKRRHTRVAYGVTVDVISAERSFVARVADISEGGVFIVTREALPIGSSCQLEIDLGFRSVSVAGRVMWHKPHHTGGFGGMGVHFEQASPASKAALTLFMQLQLTHLESLPAPRRNRRGRESDWP